MDQRKLELGGNNGCRRHILATVANLLLLVAVMSSSTSSSLQQAKQSDPSLQLLKLHRGFYLYQHPIASPLPASILSLLSKPVTGTSQQSSDQGEGFLTISRTPEEWSIMIHEDTHFEVERETLIQGPFGCLKVRGPMELSE